MSKEKELAKNTIIIMLGKFCTQFITFILVPFYTYFLDTSEYGTVDLIITYVNLFVPVISIQLEMALFRFLIDNRKNKEEQTNIFTNALAVVSIIILFLSIIYLIIAINTNIKYCASIWLCVVATIYSNLFLQASRGLGDNINYSIACVVTALSNIIFNILFVVILKINGNGILLSTAISNMLCAIYIFLKKKIYLIIDIRKVNKNLIFKLLKYSFPLVPNSIMWWIINASDRTIISIFIGSTANGIYAVSHKFSTIVASVYNMFNLAWTESTSLHINDKDKDSFFSRTLNKIIFMSSALCCCMIAILPFCFNIIISSNYIDAFLYIPLLLIGAFLNIIISFIGSIYIALKRTKDVAKTSLLSGIINIVTNLLLVNKIGIWASSLSTIISFFIMTIYRLKDVQKYVVLKIKLKTLIIVFLEFFVSIAFYYSNNILLNIFSLIIIVILALVTNLEIIKNFISVIIDKLKKHNNNKII